MKITLIFTESIHIKSLLLTSGLVGTQNLTTKASNSQPRNRDQITAVQLTEKVW